MTEQTLFNQYLSGSITHAQYIGNLKQINEKHIQDQRSKTPSSATKIDSIIAKSKSVPLGAV
jgi:hypothetical protein